MPAILLGPLFISNADQAGWLHGPAAEVNLNKLSDAIAAAIKGQFPGGGVTGLSPGHLFKTSAPNDKGSKCTLGDMETNHILPLVERVGKKLRS